MASNRTAAERLAEHKADPLKKGKFTRMEVLVEGLTHDEAHSIESALIRKRMDERLSYRDRANLSVQEQLKKSGLLNKNRGQAKERWTSDNPLNDLKDKMYTKPQKVEYH